MGERIDDLTRLRALVRGDVDDVRRALDGSGAEAAGFFRFAHRHQLGAFAYHELRRLGLAGALPPRLLAATKASSMTERLRTERLCAQLRDLAGLLEGGGADVLFLKGPLFAERFYGSVDARGFSDLDLLLRSPADLDRVEALLLGAGFEPAFRTLLGRRASRRFTHHFEYRRDGLPLDVHWELQRHFSFAIDYGRLRRTAVRAPFAGRLYPTTSDEYELVLQILGILTDLQVGRLTLRSLVDVYRVVQTIDATTDWDSFLAQRARERIARPAVYVLALVLDVFESRERFPALAAALEPRLAGLPSRAVARRAVLESRPLDPGQKTLALRLYETSLPAAFAWWLATLPFRFAVYGVSPNLVRRG